MQEFEGSTPTGGTCLNDFSNPIDQDIRTQWALSWKTVVSEWRSVISVSLNVGDGARLIKPAKLFTCTQKHYNHNEDGRMAPGVCGNGSVPLSHSGNVVTRIGTHTHTLFNRHWLNVVSTLWRWINVDSILFQWCVPVDAQCILFVFVLLSLCHLSWSFADFSLSFQVFLPSFCVFPGLFASFRVFLRLFASFRVFLPTNPYLPGSFCRLLPSF